MHPYTATSWAWTILYQITAGTRRFRSTRLQAPHRLALLAAAHRLDIAVARARAVDGDMFHHYVLDEAVTGFDGQDLADQIGVTPRTALGYCRDLADAGLLRTTDNRRFALPKDAWICGAEPTDPTPRSDNPTAARA